MGPATSASITRGSPQMMRGATRTAPGRRCRGTTRPPSKGTPIRTITTAAKRSMATTRQGTVPRTTRSRSLIMLVRGVPCRRTTTTATRTPRCGMASAPTTWSFSTRSTSPLSRPNSRCTPSRRTIGSRSTKRGGSRRCTLRTTQIITRRGRTTAAAPSTGPSRSQRRRRCTSRSTAPCAAPSRSPSSSSTASRSASASPSWPPNSRRSSR
mmetsp:Transcript_7583/g.19228  ORF Transcript_7583/g.19228 Transcript_7583/m.19228 type:complete len:211 (-) Transcript_7583:1434-2066(-)